jgi:hypothetical protein
MMKTTTFQYIHDKIMILWPNQSWRMVETCFNNITANELLIFGGEGGLPRCGLWTILSKRVLSQVGNPERKLG